MYKQSIIHTSNQSRILECIYRNAPISRKEISDLTGIKPAAVTNTISTLRFMGIVEELGEAPREEVSSGRKRILLDVCPSYAYSIGVEFTEKALVFCLFDMKGKAVSEHSSVFTQELAAHITDIIIDGINRLAETGGTDWTHIIGIGIAVPGHISYGGKKLVTNQKVWDSFEPERVRESFQVPVVMENNARCMAMGEYLFERQRSLDSFALFHVGRGMFCANMVNGNLFTGSHYVAGEIGHTIVNRNGNRCECGKKGCLQTYASEAWLIKRARLLYENSPNTILNSLVSAPEEITIRTVLAAYSMGDPVIRQNMQEALGYLSISVSNIAIIMNPKRIFLHGEMFQDENIALELMDHINQQLVFVGDPYVESIEILPYSITDGARGAGALAISSFLIGMADTDAAEE